MLLNLIFINFENNGLSLDEEAKKYLSDCKSFQAVSKSIENNNINVKMQIELGMIAALQSLSSYFFEKIISLDINIDDDKSEIFLWIELAQFAKTLLNKVVEDKIKVITEKQNDIRHKN